MGFKALPCPVAQNTKKDQEIQRKIMELKKERQEKMGEMEMMQQQHSEKEEDVSVTSCCVALPKLPPGPPQTPESPNNHVSFGPEFVRYIPPRNNKFWVFIWLIQKIYDVVC